MSDIHIGDIGTIFILTIMDGTEIVNISSASTMEITFTDPSSSKTVHTASLTTDGTDGKMEYETSSPGILAEAGEWQWQGRIVIPSGDWKTNILTFDVETNL